MQEIRLSNKTNKLELDPYSYQFTGRGIAGAFPRDVPVYGDTEDCIYYRRVPEKMPEDIFITDYDIS